MPQEEEEETVSQIEKTSLLNRGACLVCYCGHKPNMLVLCVIIQFLFSGPWECNSFSFL